MEPRLRHLLHGRIARLLDDLNADRSRPCARRSRPRPEVRYLSPYSPDLNPIELAVAKLKALPSSRAEMRPLPRPRRLCSR
jgi:transposase